MMKNFKLFLLSFVLIAGFLTSCSNNESVVEEQNIDETEAITTSLNRLAEQFNDEGYVIETDNPSGNIVFDFCFDFVYPLNLSYNNGTTVSINSLDDLITILINSTDNLYISGVEFPFNVETYNDATNAIEIVTINNENEFFDLLDDCDFDSDDDCECFEVYEPVCVEVQAPDGENFVITYPNECYAICDGFTPNNFVENCANDGNNTGGFECFEFNFPITIITDDQQTITVNSQEELDNALYSAYYFDFVYPFNVTDDEGEVESVDDLEDLIDLLEDCYDDDEEDCPCTDNVDPVCVATGSEIITFLNACEAECEGFTQNDFVDCGNSNECDECDDQEFNPVCVEVEVNGEMQFYTFPNVCYALCEGFTPNNFVDCDNNNPGNCSEQDVFEYLLECEWYINTSLYDNVSPEYAQFFLDGQVEIYNEGSDVTAEGTWSLASNPATDEVFVSFLFANAPYGVMSQIDWTVVLCSENFIVLESGSEFIQLERDCD